MGPRPLLRRSPVLTTPEPGPVCALSLWLLAAVAPGCAVHEADVLDLEARLDLVAARPAGLAGDLLDTADADRLDVSDGLRLAEGEFLALCLNAGLREARARAGVPAATAAFAGLLQDPVLGLDASQILDPTDVFEWGLGLGWTAPVSGIPSARKGAADAAARAALAAVEAQEWALRAEVRRAWGAWSALEQRRALVDGVLDELDRIGGVAGRLADAGAMRSADRRLIEIQRLQRANDLLGLERESANARARLVGLLGLLPDAEVELVPTLELPSPVQAVLVGGAVHPGPDGHPALRSASAAHAAADETLRLEVRRQWPGLGLQLGGGDTIDGDTVDFGLSSTLPLWNRNRGAIARATAQRNARRTEAESLIESLAREVQRASRAHGLARAQREAAAETLLPLLGEQIQNVDALARLGDVDTFLALSTVQAEFDARTRILDLRLLEFTEAVRLVEACGDGGGAPTTEPER